MSWRSHVRALILGQAANEAFRRGYLDPLACNRAFGVPQKSEIFSMNLGQLGEMRVWVSDWEDNEARIAAALWPTAEVDYWLSVTRSDALAGQVRTSGYLYRGHGVYLENSSTPGIYIHRSRVPAMKSIPQPREDYTDDLRMIPKPKSPCR